MDPGQTLFRLQGFEVLRNEDRVCGPIDLALKAGAVVLLQGPNGCGKTTLLRALVGLVPADLSRAFFLEQPLSSEELEVLPCLYLGHRLGLTDDLTCAENITIQIKLFGRRAATNISSVLASVGLSNYAQTPAGKLSAGQRKRLALAKFVACPAPLWLLDEPYSNLDAEGIALVDRLLSRHIMENGSALLTSHGTYVPNLPDLAVSELAARVEP